MAMHVPQAPGFSSMLKEGAKFMKMKDDVLFGHIKSAISVGEALRSSYGPLGSKKLLINGIEKVFVTKDAASIVKELAVENPVANLVVMCAEQQEQESGEGTNFVIQLTAFLLEEASYLLKMGLSIPDITRGIEMAVEKIHSSMDDFVVEKALDLRNEAIVTRVLNSVVRSKMFDYEDVIGPLVAKACINVLSANGNFNVDNIRVVKIQGGSIDQSRLVSGLVFERDAHSDVRHLENAQVAVFGCAMDALQTETKGTVLLNTAAQLQELTHGEENEMEKRIKELAATGCKLIVTGGKVGDLALHYANRYGLMVLKLSSKFDVRRVCRLTGASPLAKFGTPTLDQLGTISRARTDEIGKKTVVVLEQETGDEGAVSTIVIRGSMLNLMNEMERAIDDAVNTYKCLTRDNRLVAGAGAIEMQLAHLLETYAKDSSSLEQYGVVAFANALRSIVGLLVENSGDHGLEKLADLKTKHCSEKCNMGFVYRDGENAIQDALSCGIVDLFCVKYWACSFAAETACTVLRIDQIVMSKPSGGPQPGRPKPDEEND